jgi:hypothetical protein
MAFWPRSERGKKQENHQTRTSQGYEFVTSIPLHNASEAKIQQGALGVRISAKGTGGGSAPACFTILPPRIPPCSKHGLINHGDLCLKIKPGFFVTRS